MFHELTDEEIAAYAGPRLACSYCIQSTTQDGETAGQNYLCGICRTEWWCPEYYPLGWADRIDVGFRLLILFGISITAGWWIHERLLSDSTLFSWRLAPDAKVAVTFFLAIVPIGLTWIVLNLLFSLLKDVSYRSFQYVCGERVNVK